MSRRIGLVCVTSALIFLALGCRSEHESRGDDSRKTENQVEQRQRTEWVVEPRERERAPAPIDLGLRFQHRTGELPTVFVGRSAATIDAIEGELMILETHNAALRNAELAEEITDTRKALIHARKGLEQVRSGKTDIPLDDARLGVTVAINRALGQLEEAKEELKQTPPAM